jgi:hypothetical protein
VKNRGRRSQGQKRSRVGVGSGVIDNEDGESLRRIDEGVSMVGDKEEVKLDEGIISGRERERPSCGGQRVVVGSEQC